jgi:hypothetical protein
LPSIQAFKDMLDSRLNIARKKDWSPDKGS